MKLENRVITFSEYQDAAKSTDVYPDDVFNIGYKALGLCGEAGEVADKIKKYFRGDKPLDDNYKFEIAKELGDVLWYLTTLGLKLGLNLSDIASMNIDKLFKRKEENKIKGSGDNR